MNPSKHAPIRKCSPGSQLPSCFFLNPDFSGRRGQVDRGECREQPGVVKSRPSGNINQEICRDGLNPSKPAPIRKCSPGSQLPSCFFLNPDFSGRNGQVNRGGCREQPGVVKLRASGNINQEMCRDGLNPSKPAPIRK